MAQYHKFPLVMKATTVITAFATLLLALLTRFYSAGWLLPTAISIGTTCYHFAMRLAVGYVLPPLIPQNAAAKPWFRQKSFESKLYMALKVKVWKDHMPTYDPRSFSLRENTLEQIIYNSCVSECVHEVIMLFSFIPLLFALIWETFPAFLITSTLAALFDCCFVIMQRYNRPRLIRILSKKEANGL